MKFVLAFCAALTCLPPPSVTFQLKNALRLGRQGAEALSADPVLEKIYLKYMEPRSQMYEANLVFIST